MFLSLGIILVCGLAGGFLFSKLQVPKLVWYLVLGILLGPSVLNFLDQSLLEMAPLLRQIALVIILTRSGLSLEVSTLKKIGRPAILMSFIPALFEIIGISIIGPLFLGISFPEALLLGSVIAAVSPAVVVPRMIKMQEEGYGENHHVAELIMAGSSSDDIFVIVLFYTFKELVATTSFNAWSLIEIPTSIISGVIVGLVIGLLLAAIYRKVAMLTSVKVVILLGTSLALLGLESWLKPFFAFSALLAIIVLGITIYKKSPQSAVRMKKHYENLWQGFEILLFTLIGAVVDLSYAFSSSGLFMLITIILALFFRSFGVIASLIKTSFTVKEKIFMIIAYLPKATVQASIGAIALNEGLPSGELILTAAVISILFTAPLGALLIDQLKMYLLVKPREALPCLEKRPQESLS